MFLVFKNQGICVTYENNGREDIIRLYARAKIKI